MTVIFLTSASTSPWTRVADWSDSGHTVEIVGCGGKSGAAATGAASTSAAGGGGGGYQKLTWSSVAMTSTMAFEIKSNNTLAANITANATCWEATAITGAC